MSEKADALHLHDTKDVWRFDAGHRNPDLGERLQRATSREGVDRGACRATRLANRATRPRGEAAVQTLASNESLLGSVVARSASEGERIDRVGERSDSPNGR